MVIKNARVVLQDGVKRLDVKVENGKIAELSESIDGVDVIDAEERYLLPAMVDIGVKVKDSKLRGESIRALCEDAGVNGFSTVVLSALCDPPIDNEIALEFVKSQAGLCSGTNFLTLLSGVRADGGLSDCSILLKEGAVGIEFGSDIDGNLIRRLMEYAQMHGVKLFCRANDPALHGEGVMHEGRVSCRLGLAGVPAAAESSQVARIAELAEFYGVEVIVLGASTSRTLKICAQSDRMVPQVPIHHLILNDTRCDGYNTAGKIWPPLRDEAMRKEMLEALAYDDSAMITSLHTPVSETAKDAVFADAAYGVEGFDSFLPLLYTHLVKKGSFDLPALVRMVSSNPAKAVGLEGKKGAVLPGYDADLILFDPDFDRSFDDLLSPYDGMRVSGRVLPV